MATYYISPTGNDSNDGTSTSTPWKTLAKVNEQSYGAGDIISFERGGEWYGEFIIDHAAPNNNALTINAYGIGENPKIHGWKTLSGWVDEGNGIYSVTDNSLLSKVKMLTIDGGIVKRGRFPKTAWWRVETGSGSTSGSISSSDLSGQPNFAGGQLVFSKNPWVIDVVNITAHSGNTLNWDGGSAAVTWTGYGFFIQNHISGLSEFGDWMYDSATKKLTMFFGLENPENYEIKVTSIEKLFYSRFRNNVLVEDLHFEGSNEVTFDMVGWNVNNYVVRNCKFTKNGFDAILLGSTSEGFTLENCLIEDTYNRGIETSGCNNVDILNNIFRRTSTNPGESGNGNFVSTAIGCASGGTDNGNYNIIGNRIIDSGYNAIRFAGSNVLIEKNYIENYNLIKVDGGGIYCYGTGTPPYVNRVIRKNIISNSNYTIPIRKSNSNEEGYGIYFDEKSRNIICEDNILFDNNAGIYLHCAGDIDIKRNLIYRSRTQGIILNQSLAGTSADSYITALDVQNNIIFGIGTSIAISVTNLTTGDPDGFGVIDNNVYVFPEYNNVFRKRSTGGSNVDMDYVSWQVLGWYDALSILSPVTESLSTLEYNDTEVNVIITPELNTTDVYGNEFIGDITLLPFEGIIIIGQGIPPEPPVPEPQDELIFPSNPTLNQRYPEQGETYTPHYKHIGNNVWDFVPPSSTDLSFTPENVANKITEWSETPSDVKYPSEKLAKESIDNAQEAVSGIKIIDYTTEIGTEHTYTILPEDAGKTIRIKANLDDIITIAVGDDIDIAKPITVMKEFEGQLILNKIGDMVITGSGVENNTITFNVGVYETFQIMKLKINLIRVI